MDRQSDRDGEDSAQEMDKFCFLLSSFPSPPIAVPEKLLSRIHQSFDGGHILGGEGEIEQVEVLLHPIFVDGLRDDDDIALEQEAQGDLCGGLSILCADGGQNRVGEHIFAALCERTPRLDLAAVLFQVLLGDLLLLEDVGFDLIDRRLNLGEVLDVQIAVGAKVRYADGANFTGCPRVCFR